MQINCYTIKENKIILQVKVKPNSQSNKITKIINNELCININAQPEKGKANKKLIAFLSKILKVPKIEIDIVKGATNSHKIIHISKKAKISLDILLKKTNI